MPSSSPETPPTRRAEEANERAILMAADAIGDVIAFWNFKPSMGRVWAILYLSRAPMAADEIAERAGLSAGSVSMTLQDLMTWGVIRKAFVPDDRRRFFEPNTDILSMVTRVFRERELRVVGASISQMEEALRILDEEGRSSHAEQMLENRFVATRLRNLLALARVGYNLIDAFSKGGMADLRALHGALSNRG